MYYKDFEVRWQVSLDGGKTWLPAGTSKNDFYYLRDVPDSRTTLFHTVIHLGCNKAKGKATEDIVRLYVWNEFKDRVVMQVAEPPVGTERQLTYWAGGVGGASTVAGLLSSPNGNGDCVAWSRLFRDCLRVHNIPADIKEVKPVKDTDKVMLVKKWNFYTPSGSGLHPYKMYTDVAPASGIPAQGNPNPIIKNFENHVITESGETYYDPSYGTDPVSGAGKDKAYEDAAFDGFAAARAAPGVWARQNDTTAASPKDVGYTTEE